MSSKNSLILFTRYPEPGKVKTRLLKSLTPQKAAEIHKKMTENTLYKIKDIKVKDTVSLKIFYEGGSSKAMKNWLGNYQFERQVKGDLGKRMSSAFNGEFENNREKVVIIGSDCPALKVETIIEAYEKLSNNDLVLGPAEDGGYYLIGLKNKCDSLFKDISWGTENVLKETEIKAKNKNYNVFKLETLADVDRPEDLKLMA